MYTAYMSWASRCSQRMQSRILASSVCDRHGNVSNKTYADKCRCSLPIRQGDSILRRISSCTSRLAVGIPADTRYSERLRRRPRGRRTESNKRRIRRGRLRGQRVLRGVKYRHSPSQRFLPLLTTKTPCSWDRLVSQTPPASYPTQLPPRLARGEAQAKHSDALGPVHVVHAGEQLEPWSARQEKPLIVESADL